MNRGRFTHCKGTLEGTYSWMHCGKADIVMNLVSDPKMK